MSFESMMDFLSMGGHGLYVWTAYGITLVVFVLQTSRPVLLEKRFYREQEQLHRRVTEQDTRSNRLAGYI